MNSKSHQHTQKDCLKRRLTVEQAETEIMAAAAKLGLEPAPSFLTKWRDMIARMQPVDELWEYSYDNGPLFAGGGFAVVRNGEVVAEMSTWRS